MISPILDYLCFRKIISFCGGGQGLGCKAFLWGRGIKRMGGNKRNERWTFLIGRRTKMCESF